MDERTSSGLSRRQFITGAGAGALGLAGMGLAGCSGEQTEVTLDFAKTVPWNASYDVVIVGLGGAGATAAITAADAGAKVLVVEKAPLGDEGGNSAVCDQYILTWKDEQSGIDFLNVLAKDFETSTPEILSYMAKGGLDNIPWLESLGATDLNRAGGGGPIEILYKYFGETTIKELQLCGWVIEQDSKWYLGEYEIWPDGQMNGDRMWVVQVGGVDNDEKKLWKLLRKHVKDRADKIDLWLESPAVHLIQDPFSKAILGVEVSKKGEQVFVRATNGVILACGSYEANPQMNEKYTQRTNCFYLGSEYNTGDGIVLGEEVGAQMWHMAAVSGPWMQPKYAGMDRCQFASGMSNRLTSSGRCIYVGGNAKRFYAEYGWHKHGHVDFGGTRIPQMTPDRIWMVFDDIAFKDGGEVAKLDQTAILSANTVEELAALMEVDGATLSATVARYNGYANTGVDLEYARPAFTMETLETPPFHALRLWACYVNTQGGPKRNVNCEVLDPNDEAIPNLYSAGELGSFFAGAYQGGGNVAEYLYTGRTAGTNAAQPKEAPGAGTFQLVDGQQKSFENDLLAVAATVEVVLGENEYRGEAEDLHGLVVVKVTYVDGKIMNVEVVDQHGTEGITDKVWSDMPTAIVAANSIDVQTISGATVSSNALKTAIENAIAQAK